ncbi:hypothetical protein BRADI_4g03393v3 [Brachypodium distachyon]|uniref:Uncharacterized protein n=1 Tax=Brachypodium distachyon TaxID=15368 RepID=A0A0Q3EID9_BRADI|nr:hypothetical protein BRADI_4g03393v3 [Brachypodium distachyon]
MFVALKSTLVYFDRSDVDGNAQNGPIVRLSFVSLIDALGLLARKYHIIMLIHVYPHIVIY